MGPASSIFALVVDLLYEANMAIVSAFGEKSFIPVKVSHEKEFSSTNGT